MQKVIIGTFLFLLLIPGVLLAHGTQIVGRVEQDGYVATVDSIVPELHAGQAERLNFELERKSATSSDVAEVMYTDAWMRITGPGDEVLFVGNIKRAPEGLVTGFSFQYPAPGQYEVTLRFLNDTQVLTEASFPITILPNTKNTQHINEWMFALGGLVVGFLCGATFKRGRKN